MATLTNETVASTYTYLLKMDGTSGVDGNLRRVQDGDATNSALSLSTAGIKSTGTLEVTGNTSFMGNVGVGVASPAYTLEIEGSNNELVKFTSTDATCYLRLQDDTTSGLLGIGCTANQLKLTTDGTVRMVLDSTGVGIGTASPATKLHVIGGTKLGTTAETGGFNEHTVILSDGNVASQGGLLMTNVDSASAGYSSIKFNVTGSGTSGAADLHIGVVDNDDPNTFIRQHMHLDGATGNVYFNSGGKVGIGIGSATAKLHIDQSSASGAMPVLRLDQADIDDTFIDFIGTTASDGSRSISTDTTVDESDKFGAVAVEINGVKKWLRVYDTHS